MLNWQILIDENAETLANLESYNGAKVSSPPVN